MPPTIDLVGQRFGRLVVVSRAGTNADNKATWNSVCDCGNTTVSPGRNLRAGITKSCGCLASEAASKMGANREYIAIRAAKAVKHGHKKRAAMSPEYRTWLGIKRRCSDPKAKGYDVWGGRGITVCDEWNESFETFLSDMGNRPSPTHQIDRIDPNGHYTKDNCRWVTPTTQASEHRRNIYPVTVDGISFPSLAAACRHYGVNETAALYRISNGIPPEVAVREKERLKPRRTRESYLPKGHPDRLKE